MVRKTSMQNFNFWWKINKDFFLNDILRELKKRNVDIDAIMLARLEHLAFQIFLDLKEKYT